MLDNFKPKLIAFDIDGTVLNDKGELTQRTIAALKRAMASGISVICATGRMYPSALPILRRIGVTEPSVVLNGGQIRNPVTHEIIYEQALDSETTMSILNLYHERGWYIQLYHDDKLLVVDDSDKRCKFYEEVSGVKAVPLGDDFWKFDYPSTKMLAVSFDPDTFKVMLGDTNSMFTGRIHSSPSQKYFIELGHPEVNKARSLERAAELLGIERRNVLAFGDGANDMEMLAWAGVGAATAGAGDSVKAMADIIVPDNNCDGVALTIEKILDEGRL